MCKYELPMSKLSRKLSSDRQTNTIEIIYHAASWVVRNVYSVSQKNIPDIFSYNSRKHCRIFIIFGTHITEKLGNQ